MKGYLLNLFFGEKELLYYHYININLLIRRHQRFSDILNRFKSLIPLVGFVAETLSLIIHYSSVKKNLEIGSRLLALNPACYFSAFETLLPNCP